MKLVWKVSALTVLALGATLSVVVLFVYSYGSESQRSSAGLPAHASPQGENNLAEKKRGTLCEPVMDRPAIQRAQEIRKRPLGHVKASVDELRGLLTDKAQPAALRNTVANRLGEIEDEELPAALRQMLFDEEEWPKWRGYCVQQLHECYLREQESDACLDAIFEATEIDEPMIRKAAIWNLALIAKSRQEEKRPSAEKISRIRQEVMRVLGEKDAAEEVTLAAVQAAGQMGIAEALPAVRAVVADEKTSKPFRLRAVTVLGKLGDESDLPLLERIGSTGTDRMKKMVATAIGRIKTRGEVEEPKPQEPAERPRPEAPKF